MTTSGDRGRIREEIEAEIATERRRVADTAEALKERASSLLSGDGALRALIDEGGSAASDVAQRVRDNPMAAALIGVGVAWLLASGSSRDRDALERLEEELEESDWRESAREAASRRYRDARDRVGRSGEALGESMEDRLDTARSRARDGAEAVEHRLRDVASAATDRLRDVGQDASERARDFAERAEHRARDVGARAKSASREAGRRAAGFTEDHPLLVGALAFAAGAAIGGALANTRAENRAFGGRARDLRRSGREAGHESAARAKAVAEAAAAEARAIRDEAYEAAGRHADSLRENVERTPDAVGSIAERIADAAANAGSGRRTR